MHAIVLYCVCLSEVVGTTTVKVTVINADDEPIAVADVKVTVKKNAAAVAVTGIADGDSFKVGQTVDITLPRAGVDTDARALVVDNADVVELKAGEKARTWTAKFLKAGDAKFTATAFQSKKFNKATATAEVNVKVEAAKATEVKVIASNAYELTFDMDVEAAGLYADKKEIANDACYYMVNDTKVTFSAIKEIKTTGNTVKVTMYDNFKAGTTYNVAIPNSDVLSFAIAGDKAKDVVKVAILTDTAVVNTAAEVKVALYNADGVDITSSVGLDTVSITTSNLNSYTDGLTLNMYNVGDVTDVVATFKYYDPNNNYAETAISSEVKKITAVNAAADVYSGLVFTVDAKNTTEISANYDGAKNYIAIGDEGYNFKALVKYTNNGVNKTIVVGKAGQAQFNGFTLTAKVPEEATALITADDLGTGMYPITANTVGTTNVFIGYTDWSQNWVTVCVAPIEVKAQRVPTTLTVKTTKSNLNTTASNADEVKLQAEVKDQYGDFYDIAAAALVTTQNDQSKAVAELLFDDLETIEVEGTKWSRTDAGKYELSVKNDNIAYAVGKDTASIVLSTKVNLWYAKTATVSNNFVAKKQGIQKLDQDQIIFSNNGEAALDTTITGWNQIKAAKLALTSQNSGYYTGDVNFTQTTTVPTRENVGTAAAVEYSFKLVVKKDGVAKTAAEIGANFINVGASSVTLKNFYVDGSGAINKLATGNYTFTVYKIKKTDKTTTNVISSQTIVVNVKDSQGYPSFVQLAETATDNGTGALNECFDFYFAGNKVDKASAVNSYTTTAASAATNAWFVNKANVKVTVPVQDTTTDWSTHDYTFDLDCNINKLIKKK